MLDILVSVSAGILGLAGAGALAFVLAAMLWRPRPQAFGPSAGLLVLIPAHQEEKSLPGTLASVRAAAAHAQVPVRVIVGADDCSDRTAALARDLGAEVEVLAFRSKWKTLARLAQRARDGEWVALVDAGAIWPVSLLSDLRESFLDAHLLAVAPAYFPRGASRIERLLWRMEAGWKKLENLAGGPVSVHGATVFFRAEALRAALSYLSRFGREIWLNDDVAVPFAARLACPGGGIRYWCPHATESRVSDSGIREDAPQAARRKRMVAGNLEWMVTLFPRAIASSPVVALVAVRRVARVLWAYWALALLYAACFAFSSDRIWASAAAAAAAALGAGTLVILGKRSLVEAAWASALAPVIAVSVLRGRSQAWS